MPPMKPTRIPTRSADTDRDGSGYWQRLRDLATELNTGAINAADPLWNAPIDRRRALQLLGASLALAGLPACAPQPEEHLVPYVRMPEHLVPGKSRYYATTALVGGYAHGILAESHEGRPTKVEGNPDHPATLGACDAIAQASVLSLYDPDRAKAVRHRNRVASFQALLDDLDTQRAVWNANQGRGLWLLTGALTSPSEITALRQLLDRWPEARWCVHEPIDRSAVHRGSEMLFGQALEPRYRFDWARVVLSLDADFLQSQPGFVRYSHDLASQRRPRDRENTGQMLRLYALESTPGITGAVADHRLALSYPEIESATRQLAAALGLDVNEPVQPLLNQRWLQALVDDLQAAAGAAVVVPGDQQTPVVHALAQAINHRLEAFGGPVEWQDPIAARENSATLAELTEAIRANEVSHLVVLDSNPVFSAPGDLDFEAVYREVPWRLQWSSHLDETGRLSHWHLPAAHPLEAWADARAYDGTVSLIQPLIRPLNGGKTALQMLHVLSESTDEDARELLRGYWQARYQGEDFERFWRQSLHDGLVARTRAEAIIVEPLADWPRLIPAPATLPKVPILQLRPDPALWDGRYANNGWLQEMPRPLTTHTWHNLLLVSPYRAREHGWQNGDEVQIGADSGHVTVPVYVLEGQPDNAVSLYLGQGHEHLGRVANGVGVNAFTLRRRDAPWAMPVTLIPTGGHQELAVIQAHHSIEGRDLIRSATLEEYRANPHFAQHPEPHQSLYPEPWPAERDAEHAWGMSVDLSACIGCNACVTACQAENNIPVVGPEEVSRGHDMHWIRVDRYLERPLDDPRLVFQPVPCMHCENAPCEYVCPVGATLHSADGLNQMVYQRCVGTRYCSQNCPYKVRRFNWFNYTGPQAPHPAEPAVQNPNVTVRSRGVMEKCTYCVQRIQAARIQADAQGRPLADNEPRTACQEACPTQAIVFGDLNNPDSEVSRLKQHPLNYAMLGHLNTRPRTTYLAAVHNPNRALDHTAAGEG